MRINFGFLGMVGALFALVGLAPMACTTDKAPAQGAGGSAGSMGGTTTSGGAGGGAGGAAGSSTTTTPAGGTACAKSKLLPVAKPGITNFDSYDGATDLSTWSFPLGGDTSTAVFAGTFGYGDRANNVPGTFDMATGHSPAYALEVADTMAQVYGGGMGIWISDCLNATAFSGVSFWVRGVAPTGTAKMSLFMSETTAATPAKTGNKTGTCPGTDTTCIHPKFEFPVTDTWTQIKAPWAAFTPGDPAGGTKVTPDGHNIWQVQYDIGLNFVPSTTDSTVYVPVPAAYDLVVDDLTFY